MTEAEELRRKELARARSRRYYAKHKEARAEQAKAYRSKNLEAMKAKHQEWKKANPDKVRAGRKRWADAHPEKISEINRKQREKDPVATAARKAEYKKLNKEKVRVLGQNRRARKKRAGGRLSKDLALKLFFLQKGKCACCGAPLGDSYHLDHIVPLALGGSNTDDNMQLLTAKCNLQKGPLHPVEFMQSRGRLL